MLVGPPAWRKTEIHVQNLTTDQHQSNVQGRNKAWVWGGSSPPPKRRRSPLKLGQESVFLHCCFGHHAVVTEGYLFVVFCIVDIVGSWGVQKVFNT